MLYRRSDRVSSNLGPDISAAYYEAVTDLMFSLSLLIARPISCDRSVRWFTACCISCRCCYVASVGGGGGSGWQEGAGGHGNIFGGNLKSIDQSQQIKRKTERVYSYLIIL